MTGNRFSYRNYLRSEAWSVKRIERLRIDKFICQNCGSKKKLVVHHLHYRNIFNEDVNKDLITLCENCHNLIHAKKLKLKRITKRQKKTAKPWSKQLRKLRKRKTEFINHEQKIFLKQFDEVCKNYATTGKNR